jgi:low affinity Fe/Cu permease
MSNWFTKISTRIAELTGHYIAFIVALGIIIVWALSGPLFGFSDTWQLVINTGTTVVTFLMVFLIQHTQNRDARAVHLKLDEIIGALENADNSLMSAEDETDEKLKELKLKYEALCDEHSELEKRLSKFEAPVRAGNGATNAE